MDRRGFLKALAALPIAAAAAASDVELWVPSKTIILPPAGGWPINAGELSDIVRRAFVPKLVTQIYRGSPLMAAIMKQNFPMAQEVKGTISKARRAKLDQFIDEYLDGIQDKAKTGSAVLAGYAKEGNAVWTPYPDDWQDPMADLPMVPLSSLT